MADFTKFMHNSMSSDFHSTSSSCPGAPTKSVFVGDLSFFCTEIELAMAFSPFGEISALEIKRGRYGDSLMHGFVEYTTDVAAQNAIMEMNGKKFMGRKMRVNRTNVKVGPNPGYAEWVQIHVNFQCPNLTTKVSEEFLDNVFCTFGSIGDITVKRHLCSREPVQVTGYAFVYFLEAYAALRAIHAIKGVTIDGVTMECCLTYRSEQALMNQTGVANVLRLQQSAVAGANNSNSNMMMNKTHSNNNNLTSKRPPMIPQQQQQPAVMSMHNKQSQGHHSPFFHPQQHTAAHSHYSPSSVALSDRLSPSQQIHNQQQSSRIQYNSNNNNNNNMPASFQFEREFTRSSSQQLQLLSQQQPQQPPSVHKFFHPQNHQFSSSSSSSLFGDVHSNNNLTLASLGFATPATTIDSGLNSYNTSRSHSDDEDVLGLIHDLRAAHQQQQQQQQYSHQQQAPRSLLFEDEKDLFSGFAHNFSNHNSTNSMNNITPSMFDTLFNF